MIRPLRDHVLVRPSVIPLSAVLIVENREPYNRGEVVAVGPGAMTKGGLRAPDVSVGDQVRYGNGSYLDWPILEHGGERYQMIREGDIAGIVEP